MTDGTPVSRAHTAQLFGMIALLRPKQWIKNSFVLAPLIFTGMLLRPESVSQALLAVMFFCIASSASYIVNDLHDREADRKHPRKALTRPLAAGIITAQQALVMLCILYTLLLVGWFVQPDVMPVITSYVLLNLAYTFALKQQPVIDIFTVALGFVLRVYAGALALAVPVSTWMFVTTLCLALYLAAIKRRQELRQVGAGNRKVLEQYSVALVDRYAEMSATGALVFYSMFVMSARPELVITVPIVLFGLFRYWYVVEKLEGGESPTDVLFADWQILLAVVLWLVVCIWILLHNQAIEVIDPL